MKPPELVMPVQRRDSLVASMVAWVVLITIETVYSHAERWNHGLDYLALSAALTLAPALATGLLGSLLGLRAGDTLALFSALCIGVSYGPIAGACALVLAVLALATSAARGLRPAVLGATLALALAGAYLKCSGFAEHLGHKDDRQYETVGAVLVLGVFLAGLTFALRTLPQRVGSGARVLGLLALGCLCSLRPLLERGDGQHRQPPPDYASSAPRQTGESRPNVLVLVLDTVRADHLPLYGYGRDTMPELDRMVQERKNSVVFPEAYANGTWTVPSHASLFTGRLPNEHGAHFALDGSVRYAFGLAETVPTLAERLKAGGYATLGGYANHWLHSIRGIGRGFDRYMIAPDRDKLPFVGEALRERYLPGVTWEASKGCARASDVNTTLLSLIEPWSKGPNPLFAFANYVDAHGPYAPPPPFRGRFAPTSREERAEHLSLAQSPERHAELEARYDEELSYLDHQLGELFRELDRLGFLRSSWVFVTADHGEAFGEHAVFEHGTTVYNEVTHVPLIVFPPEGVQLDAGAGPVSLVDVSATVAAIAGVELPGPGRDLRAPRELEHPAVIEFYGDPLKAANLGELARHPARAVVLGRYKLIVMQDEVLLFDLDKDPGEHVNLANALPKVVEHLKTFLPEFGDSTFRRDAEGPTPEGLEGLRGLGYL